MTTNSASYYADSPTFNVAGEHKLGNWDLDYRAAYTVIYILRPTGTYGFHGVKGGNLTYSVTNVGWVVDRTDPWSPLSRPPARASTTSPVIGRASH
jgi:hypothetical protein